MWGKFTPALSPLWPCVTRVNTAEVCCVRCWVLSLSTSYLAPYLHIYTSTYLRIYGYCLLLAPCFYDAFSDPNIELLRGIQGCGGGWIEDRGGEAGLHTSPPSPLRADVQTCNRCLIYFCLWPLKFFHWLQTAARRVKENKFGTYRPILGETTKRGTY